MRTFRYSFVVIRAFSSPLRLLWLTDENECFRMMKINLFMGRALLCAYETKITLHGIKAIIWKQEYNYFGFFWKIPREKNERNPHQRLQSKNKIKSIQRRRFFLAATFLIQHLTHSIKARKIMKMLLSLLRSVLFFCYSS